MIRMNQLKRRFSFHLFKLRPENDLCCAVGIDDDAMVMKNDGFDDGLREESEAAFTFRQVPFDLFLCRDVLNE